MSIIPASRLSSSDLARLGNNLRHDRSNRRPLAWRRYTTVQPSVSAPRPAQAK